VSGADAVENPALFEMTYRGAETIARPDRLTSMQYDGSMVFALIAKDSGSVGSSSDENPAVELAMWVESLRLHRKAGTGSYTIVLDENKLTEQRPTTGYHEYERVDPHFEKYTVQALVDRPGTLRVRNGALTGAPKTPDLLKALDVAWTVQEIPLLLPPLPTRAIPPGRTWRAGVPLRLSMYAQPQVVRLEMRFAAYDETTGVATIRWESAPRNVALRPIDGIHHIRVGAIATDPEIHGELLLHVPTGTVIRASSSRRTAIAHLDTTDVAISFNLDVTLTNTQVDFETDPSMATVPDDSIAPVGAKPRN